MYCLFSIVISILSVIYIYLKLKKAHNSNRRLKLIKGKYFSSESLCGGFLKDVMYDLNNDSCQIPCYVNNTFQLITSQEESNCGKLSDSITIDGDMINAKSNVVIKQHKIVNRIHYANQQFLKKGENTKLISELIEVLPSNNNALTKTSYKRSDKISNSKVNKKNKKRSYKRHHRRYHHKRFLDDEFYKRSQWYLHFIPKPIKESKYGLKLSVHIILFDGGSRFVLKHQLPQTVEYLKSIRNKYSMFDMLKYHTLSHNSKPNFLPLFYGYRYNYSDENKNFHKLIFEEFNDENYITINAELACNINEIFAGKNNYTGSDHNLNPPSCDSYYRKNEIDNKPRCLGDRQIHQHYFDYFKNALSYYHLKNQPVFSVTVLKDSHDPDFKSVPRVDPDLANYLKYLNDNGIMDKSVIFLTADHGMHYGNNYESHFGKIDHSLPLLFIIFPKSFGDNNKNFFHNLLINQNRFVTAFDIHKTLLDLAHLGKKREKYDEKEGSSLFDEISKKRNCFNQRILFGCSCRVGNAKLDNDSYGKLPTS